MIVVFSADAVMTGRKWEEEKRMMAEELMRDMGFANVNVIALVDVPNDLAQRSKMRRELVRSFHKGGVVK